jgi:hypothetical protein
MHMTGRHMKSVVMRKAGGAPEVVFDEPFDFNSQTYWDRAEYGQSNVVLQPGDTIASTCTFDVPAPGGIAFGINSEQEMCYQFSYSYPAGKLINAGMPSLIGATNTCW